MASNEQKLDDILNKTLDWEAPKLKDLEDALGSLERVLADLSQTDDVKWSGAAAKSAAEAFDLLRERYRRVKNALAEVGPAVTQANAARARARAALNELPGAEVPSWIHSAVGTAKKVGDAHVVIDGYAYVADQAVGIFENWLGNRREQQAAQVLVNLQEELESPGETLWNSADKIDKALEREIEIDDDGPERIGGGGGPTPVPPVPPVPGPHLGRVPRVPGDRGLLGVPEQPGSWSGPVPNPGDGHVPTPGVPDDRHIWPPREAVPENPYNPPTPYNPNDPSWPRASDPWERGQGPNVDSGSAGTSSGNGLAAGVMGGGAAAGAAALRWGTGTGGAGGAGGAGARAFGAPGAGAPGGVGGLLGGGGSAGGTGAGGPGAARGMAGGRGMAAGLPGGGAGGAGGAAGAGGTGGAGGSAAGGAGANSSAAGAKGGMVGGGGGVPGGGSEKKGKRSGLGGHIAPKFEDDDDFIPQSDGARAGSRDDFV